MHSILAFVLPRVKLVLLSSASVAHGFVSLASPKSWMLWFSTVSAFRLFSPVACVVCDKVLRNLDSDFF